MTSPDEVRETWVVVWFPPDMPDKRRVFASEDAAQIFAAHDRPAGEWSPLIEHRITTVTSSLVPLRPRS